MSKKQKLIKALDILLRACVRMDGKVKKPKIASVRKAAKIFHKHN